MQHQFTSFPDDSVTHLTRLPGFAGGAWTDQGRISVDQAKALIQRMRPGYEVLVGDLPWNKRPITRKRSR